MKNIFSTPKKAQEFAENVTIKRNGKEVIIEDYVQTFKDDTEVYSIIEKYGSVEKIPLDTQIVEADLSGIKNLRDLKEAQIRAQKAWDNLPIEVRKEFGNDINDFRQNGLKYFQKINQEAQKAQEQALAETNTTGGQSNAE